MTLFIQNVYGVISFCHPFTITQQWHGVNLCDIVDGSDLWDINESAVRFAQRLGKQHETRTPTSNPRITIRLLKHLWLWSHSLLLLQLPFFYQNESPPHFVTAQKHQFPQKNAHVTWPPIKIPPFPQQKNMSLAIISSPSKAFKVWHLEAFVCC